MAPTITAYSEPSVFAGWPANHSLWQWDNEILVGFISGDYDSGSRGCHAVRGALFFRQLRSLDYGASWQAEDTIILENINVNWYMIQDYVRQDGDIYRIRGNYDHGGDFLDERGCFYASSDRGHTWRGPFRFSGLDFGAGYENSSRTCLLNGIFFLTKRELRYWASDEIIPAQLAGNAFEFIPEMALKRDYRLAMPSCANHNGKLFMAARIKHHPKIPDGIQIFVWHGNSWADAVAFSTGNNNGNPPSLFSKGGKLYCFYGDRERKTIEALSYAGPEDPTRRWQLDILSKSETSDFGYCSAFDAGDKGIGCLYYEDNGMDRAEIKCTFIKEE